MVVGAVSQSPPFAHHREVTEESIKDKKLEVKANLLVGLVGIVISFVMLITCFFVTFTPVIIFVLILLPLFLPLSIAALVISLACYIKLRSLQEKFKSSEVENSTSATFSHSPRIPSAPPLIKSISMSTSARPIFDIL